MTSHYENFPVGSCLLPAALRPVVASIYWFARSADDLADEGIATSAERLQRLNLFASAFDQACATVKAGNPHLFIEHATDPAQANAFECLAQHMVDYQLPTAYFHALLSAFRQDVSVTRYADDAALLDYCARSANPVGRLMLILFNADSPANQLASDQICTALQLINFWQDVAIDAQKQRIYVPLDKLHKLDIAEADYLQGNVAPATWQTLMAERVSLTRSMLKSGACLAQALPGRFGWEIRLVVQGGLRVLDKLEQVQFDVFRHRPELGPLDWCIMVWHSVRMR